jgi:hypothetical protein
MEDFASYKTPWLARLFVERRPGEERLHFMNRVDGG